MPVYFIQAGEAGAVKIGTAKSSVNRLRDLQIGCPMDLTLLREIPGGAEIERLLHGRFSDLRIRGEWFEYTDEMLHVEPDSLKSAAAPLRSSPALDRAIQKAGGVGKLAEALDITGPAISQWDRVPANRVIDIERITGVSRRDLRPDLYPPEPASQASAA